MSSPRHTLITALVAHLAAFAMCASAAPPRQRMPLAEFEIGAEGDFVILPLTIDGQEYPFLMSTGLPTTIIDESLREKLDLHKLEPQRGAARVRQERERYAGLRAFLGNIRLEFPAGVESGSYQTMRKELDIEAFGEIGMDVLAPYIVQIDFDGGRLRLLAALPPAPGEAIRTRQAGDESHVPTVQVSLAGQPAQRFLVSTARAGNSLDVKPDLLAKLEEKGSATNLTKESGVQRSGTRRFDAFRVDWAQLGSSRAERIICNASEQNAVGLSYLARFVVTFDFPRGKMYLKKSTRFADPDYQLNFSDVRIERDGEHVRLLRASAHDPASRLGLHAGDVIESINENPAKWMTNWQVRRLLGQSERAMTIVARRDGQQLTLKRNAPATASLAADEDGTEPSAEDEE